MSARSKCGRKGYSLEAPSRMPSDPTDAYPGTAAKVRVLEERAARGEHLWHPDDRSIEISEEEFRLLVMGEYIHN